MKLSFLSASGWLLLLCLPACHPEDKQPAPAEPDQTAQEPGQPTPVGKPVGEPTVRNIGPGGGTMTTPDGKLSLIFPVGALPAATGITIQPVENHVPGPFGNQAYSFQPGGLKTLKPVEVVRRYEPGEMNGTAPEAIGIAFQDAGKAWQGRVDLEVDKVNRTLKTTLPGFAHPMSYYEQFFIDPDSTVLLPGQQQALQVWYVKGRKEGDRDGLLVPLGGTDPATRVLKRSEIRNWRVNGELQGGGRKPDPVSGHFTPNDEGAWGIYYAPAAVPPRAYNPVALSVELNLKRLGMIMLVANFQISSPGTMTISGKKYENVDVVASYEKESKYLSVSLSERHPADAKSRASVSISIGRMFDGKGTYKVADNGTGDSDTKVSAVDGKDAWGHAYHHAPGGRIWGPATVVIKAFDEKSVHGTIEATLHNNHTYNHKTIKVSGEFHAAVNSR
jgi:hypothetical protein